MQITEATFLKSWWGGRRGLFGWFLKSASKPLMWLSEEWPASNDWLVEWLCCRSRWQDILLQRFLQRGSKGNRSISKFHNGKVGKSDQSLSDLEKVSFWAVLLHEWKKASCFKTRWKLISGWNSACDTFALLVMIFTFSQRWMRKIQRQASFLGECVSYLHVFSPRFEL